MTITTILLILAVVVVGYVLYAVFASKAPDYMTAKSSELEEREPEIRAGIEAESEPSAPADEPPEKAEMAPLTQAQAESPAAASEEKSAATEPAKITEFRNPETGETAANPSNYRFAKKWIKQAMVEEGLLDKVYKNKELKGATEKKVKEALNRFKELEKYQG
jgi:hypothetical protein